MERGSDWNAGRANLPSPCCLRKGAQSYVAVFDSKMQSLKSISLRVPNPRGGRVSSTAVPALRLGVSTHSACERRLACTSGTLIDVDVQGRSTRPVRGAAFEGGDRQLDAAHE